MRGGRGPEGSPQRKILDTSRQWPTRLGETAAHHETRYEFASRFARGRILDASCGCGYGSLILSTGEKDVTGVDVSQEAIDWANKYFPGPKYIRGRIEDSQWEGQFDTVVCLETIEHVKDPSPLLKALRAACKGIFVASVPNENNYPFVAKKFANDESPHYRHYTPKEFDDLLAAHGFEVVERFCQRNKNDSVVVNGTDGMFIIYACV